MTTVSVRSGSASLGEHRGTTYGTGTEALRSSHCLHASMSSSAFPTVKTLAAIVAKLWALRWSLHQLVPLLSVQRPTYPHASVRVGLVRQVVPAVASLDEWRLCRDAPDGRDQDEGDGEHGHFASRYERR